MFGISGLEFLVLAVVALLVLGPDKLPDYAVRAARLVRAVRQMASNAQSEVRKELGPEFDDLNLRDLNPKTFVSRHIFDGDDDFGLGDDDDDAPPSRERHRSAWSVPEPAEAPDAPQPPGADGTDRSAPKRAPYDDVT